MPAGPNAVVDPERLDETRCGMGDRGDAGSGSLERYPTPGLSDARHEQDASAGPHGPHVSNRPADDLDVGAGADHLPPPSASDGEEAAVGFGGGESPEEIGALAGVEVDGGDEVAGAAGAVLCGVDRRGDDDRWAVPAGFALLRVGDEHDEVGTGEMMWLGGPVCDDHERGPDLGRVVAGSRGVSGVADDQDGGVAGWFPTEDGDPVDLVAVVRPPGGDGDGVTAGGEIAELLVSREIGPDPYAGRVPGAERCDPHGWLRRRRGGQDDVIGELSLLVSLTNAFGSLTRNPNSASASKATRLCSNRE